MSVTTERDEDRLLSTVGAMSMNTPLDPALLAREEPSRARQYGAAIGPPLVALIIFLASWQVGVTVFNVPPYILPGPLHVAAGAWDARDTLVAGLAFTMRRALIGFVLSGVIGIISAIVLAQSRIMYRALYPYAVLLQTIPIITISPIIIIVFGTGDPSIVTIAFIVAVFPVISNATLGLTSVDHNLINLFQMYNATSWQQLLWLRLPFALPYILAGLRISSGLAVIGAILGEYFAGTGGTDGGLGYIIQVSMNRMLIDELVAVALLSALLGIAVFTGVGIVSYLTLHRWHESSARREN